MERADDQDTPPEPEPEIEIQEPEALRSDVPDEEGKTVDERWEETSAMRGEAPTG